MKKQYINGNYCDAENGGLWEVINPATEEIITTVPFGDDRDCLLAIDAATHAFTTWKKISPWTRADILRKAADIICTRYGNGKWQTIGRSKGRINCSSKFI